MATPPVDPIPLSEPVAPPSGGLALAAPEPAPPSDILAGPVDGTLLRLALPLLVAYVVQMGFSWVDAYFVGRLGRDALAGVMGPSFLVWALHAAVEVVSVGTMALVARAVGGRDAAAAGAVATIGVSLALGLGLVGAAIAGPGVPLAVAALGLEPVPAALAVDYLGLLARGLPVLALFLTLEAVFRGCGDTRTPMVVLAGAFALNAGLDWLLIFGHGPFPALGVRGAALASVLAQAAGVLVLGVVLLRRRGALGLAWPRRAALGLGPALRIVRIGAPPSFAGLFFCLIYVVLARITAGFGTAAVAALGLGLRLEGLAFMVSLASGRAAATMAGQNLGARQPERARLAVRRALLHATVGVAPLALVALLLPEAVTRPFAGDDAEVIAAAASYLRVVSWSLLPLAWEVVYDNVAGGVGDTAPAMMIEVVGTAVRTVIAFGLVALGAGYVAVWWSVAVTVLMKAVAFHLWFRAGRWELK